MPKTHYWSRAIIFVDMNAFFASIEQLDNTNYRNQPIVVTNGEQGSCIITASYEARRYGVKTGMRLWEARKYCPALIQVASRPKRYAQVSREIMLALESITPDVEVFSIDEAFLDVSHCQRLWGNPERIGASVKQLVWDTVKLPCSVGVASNKSLAKLAGSHYKPDGFYVIPPKRNQDYLYKLPIDRLCGVNRGIRNYLARFGANTCDEVARLPISVLSKRFGNVGRRIWLICRGEDNDPVKPPTSSAQTIGHGKILPPNTIDKNIILGVFSQLCDRLSVRLRNHDYIIRQLLISFRYQKSYWVSEKIAIPSSQNQGRDFYRCCKIVFNKYWRGGAVQQVQITGLQPIQHVRQLEFFQNPPMCQHALAEITDSICKRFGNTAIMPASHLLCDTLTPVIAPAWQPQGVRRSV